VTERKASEGQRQQVAAVVQASPELIGMTQRASETLRAAQRQTETILESITDAFYALDRDWRVTYVNERALQTFMQLKGEQLTRDDLLGHNIWDLFPWLVDTPTYRRYQRAGWKDQTVVFEYLYPPDGPWFEVHAYPSEPGLSVYFREITERKRAEAERERWARQQAIVADLGLRALGSDGLDSLIDEAVRVAARALEVDLAAVAELGDGAKTVTLRAGVGWREGAIGVVTGLSGRQSLMGYTMLVGQPVVSEDVRTDDRFEISALLADHNPVSSISVPIVMRDEPYGALGVFARDRRSFSSDDANFLRSIANVISTALERDEAARKLREVREDERSRIARDLHDEALRDLAYALVQAGRARASAGGAEVAGAVGQLVPALTRVGEQLRGAIYDLRLAGEERRPFRELLQGLADVHRAMADGCDIDLAMSEGVPEGSLGSRGTEVLRVVGEALTNARRHANARSVRVAAWGSGANLTVEVMDDGDGFDASAPAAVTGTGMKGMRERAAGVGGDLSVRSEPGGGTAVRLRVTMPGGDARTGQGVRVLLVEDHAAVRESMAAAFERESGFQVVGQAASLEQARGMLRDVDVALIDLALPDGYGGDLIAALREASPRAQALVLSGTLDRADVARAVQSGAAGALNKTVHLHEVVESVRRLRAGETLIPVREVVELLRFAGHRREQEEDDLRVLARLTPREREVLQALADGLDSRQIADRLFISLRTERNHMSNILAKLGVHSQLQALVLALRHGVVEVRPPELPRS
jgi:PAS domain S-box-containing protein